MEVIATTIRGNNMLIEKQPYYILSHEHACIAMKRKEIAINCVEQLIPKHLQ